MVVFNAYLERRGNPWFVMGPFTGQFHYRKRGFEHCFYLYDKVPILVIRCYVYAVPVKCSHQILEFYTIFFAIQSYKGSFLIDFTIGF